MTRVLGWVLCAVIAVNFMLFVLTFVPAFSGIGRNPGLADRLWGSHTVGGWRADVVWVVTSTVVIFFLGLAYAASPSAKRSPAYKLIVTSCAVWLGCFIVYVVYVFIHMMG
jgi:hypothetical protein